MSGPLVRTNIQIVGAPQIRRTETAIPEDYQVQFSVGTWEDGCFLYATVSELIELSDNLAKLAVDLLAEVSAFDLANEAENL